MPKKPPNTLNSHAFATAACLARAYDVALDLDVDEEDLEVLLDQIDAASMHTAFVLWAIHPEWRRLDDRVLESQALAQFRRHGPPDDECGRDREGLLRLLSEAVHRAELGVEAARWHGPRREHRRTAAEMAMACDHVENAIYLVDPDGFMADREATTPAERVKLASRIELIELQLEENRELIRQRVRSSN